ncbi:MAG: NACHT domain-containing protein [Chlamydiales bacterium]
MHTKINDAFEASKFLKTIQYNDKRVEFRLSPQLGLIAQVSQDQFSTIIHGEGIREIRKKVRRHPVALQRYIEQGYLTLHPILINQEQSFIIRVFPSGKGGEWFSWSLKGARVSFQKAELLRNDDFFDAAIEHYNTAIRDIQTALRNDYRGAELLDLYRMLRDSNFHLGNMEIRNNRHEEALVHFENARQQGHQEATQRLIEVNLELAGRAGDGGRTADQMRFLINARTHRSQVATGLLTELQQRISAAPSLPPVLKEPESELIGNTAKSPWVTGFQFGKGVRSGVPTSCIVRELTCRPEQATAFDQSFEHLIYTHSDIQRITNLGNNLSRTQSVWHLKAIAEYVGGLTLKETVVYCIIATTYLSPQQEVFQSGYLDENALRYLEREGFEKFTKLFGTHFIAGASKGALFLGCISLFTKDKEEAFQLMASLNGSVVGIVEGGANANRTTTEAINERILEVHTKTIGMRTPITARPTDLEGLREHHAQFRTAISNQENMSPVEAICEPWMSLPEVVGRLHQIPEKFTLNRKILQRREHVLLDANIQSLKRMYTPLRSVATVERMIDEQSGQDLEVKFNEFLQGDKKVFLLLGEAGGGKSAFLLNLERKLWEQYEETPNSIVPIRIELSTIRDPVNHVVQEYLSNEGFTEEHISELKTRGKILIILDGYDEGSYENNPLQQNLYMTNQLGKWGGKVVISGRLRASDALDPNRPDYLKRFSPIENEQIRQDLVEEAFICPFIPSQVDQYVRQFVAALSAKKRVGITFEGFQQAIAQIPGLRKIISNPFILRVVIESLPKIIGSQTGTNSLSMITKNEIYKCFTQSCFEREEGKFLKKGEPRPQDYEGANLVEAAQMFCHKIAKKMLAQGNALVLIYPEPSRAAEPPLPIYSSSSDPAPSLPNTGAASSSEPGPSFSIPSEESLDDYFGDSEEAKFMRKICSEILRESKIFVEGQVRYQYSFIHGELRDYFVTE